MDNMKFFACRQFAQRSRVRKLQYIAELESNVKALQVRIAKTFCAFCLVIFLEFLISSSLFLLQAEGSEVSAEIVFLNQQNLILSMENKALKQRLESLAQEQLIKCGRLLQPNGYSKMERLNIV